MPITRSAAKKMRQDKDRKNYNLIVRNKVRDAIKNFRRRPEEKLYRLAASLLDQASKKKIFHANKSARLKSNLSKLLKKKPAAAVSKTPSKSKKTAKLKKKTATKS